jgi:hypothetical protein
MILDVMPRNVVQLKFNVVSEERTVSVLIGEELAKQPTRSSACCLLGLLFGTEDGGSIF